MRLICVRFALAPLADLLLRPITGHLQILTHSFSRVVLMALKKAHDQNKRVNVYVTEGRVSAASYICSAGLLLTDGRDRFPAAWLRRVRQSPLELPNDGRTAGLTPSLQLPSV